MIEATICVFAKPPVAGKTKTRLAATIGAQPAAELAEAFLRDTLEFLRQFSWMQTVVAATEPFTRDYLRDHEMWLQPEGSLDQRMELILRRALQSAPMAFALGADSPGLPSSYMEEARHSLRTSDAVLGPSVDGGFYLLGVRNCPEGLLSGIEWSKADTLQKTITRLQQQGLTVALLPEWFDVDTSADLALLGGLLARRTIHCPYTRQAMLDRQLFPAETVK
jgi:rSAM/selenodomain-associated transferase 1